MTTDNHPDAAPDDRQPPSDDAASSAEGAPAQRDDDKAHTEQQGQNDQHGQDTHDEQKGENEQKDQKGQNDQKDKADTKTDAGRTQDPRTRRRIRIVGILIGVLVIIAGVSWFMSWFMHGRFHVTTDDAYVGGDQIQVNSLVEGLVMSISSDDIDQVAAGQTLVELDSSDADLEVQSASAALGVAVRGVRERLAEATRAAAQSVIADLELRRTGEDLVRRMDGSLDGTLSQEDVAHAEIAEAESEASCDAARAAHAALLAQVEGTSVSDHPQVEQSAARLRMALLAQQRTHIVAPRAGMIARRVVQVGQRIHVGQPLMSIVSLDHVWVEANFKESQLRGVQTGQAAIVHADIYGSSVTYHARVEGLEAGTGAAFALLPAQNATGNWIKIVQRLPVRLSLDPAELRSHPLRIGLSLTVDIGIGKERRTAPSTDANPPESATRSRLRMDVPQGLSSSAESVIRRIIERNASPPPTSPVTDTTDLDSVPASPVPVDDGIR